MPKETQKTARVIEVDFAGVEAGVSYVRVPESDYALEITKAIHKKGKESEKPYLALTFKLSKGPKKGNGKELTVTFSLQKQSLWTLRNLLEACGKQVPAKAIKLSLDKMVGWECAGTAVDDEYEGRKKSTISAFFPLDDLGNTSSGDDLGEGEEEEESGKEESGEEDELFS